MSYHHAAYVMLHELEVEILLSKNRTWMELICYSDCIRTEYLWFAELFRCLVLNVTTVILAKPRSANNFSHY